jgi:hypothetical protein
MSIDIEHELRLTMQDLTADLQAPPDLLSRLSRRPAVLRPRYAVALVAVAAAAVIVAVSLVVPRVGGDATGHAIKPLSTYHVGTYSPAAERQAKADMDSAIANWGPTRGDRAGDEQLMSRLRAEWDHPSSHPANLGSFEPVISPDGPVQILWAGTTPTGAAALAVQRTKDPSADYWYGIFLPDSSGNVRLAQRNQLIVGVDLGEYDPHVLSFTTSPAHTAVVVVPMHADAGVRIAFSTDRSADGRLVPHWQDAPVNDGAAVVAVPDGGNVWGAVVEISQAGEVVADHRLDFIGTHLVNEGPPEPSNLLGLWCNGCAIGGGGDIGYGLATLQAWVVRHGPLYLPSYLAEWSVGTRLPDGRDVFATQMWFVGEQAHTVVLVQSHANAEVEVLVDEVTDVTARPVVATRLPQSAGWLIGAGPAAVVTGWRRIGGDWHDVASKKALLVPTDDSSIQLRMVVGGQERIVTR